MKIYVQITLFLRVRGLALGGAPNGICDPWARWLGACLAPMCSFPFPLFPLFPFPSRWVAGGSPPPAATHPAATQPRPTPRRPTRDPPRKKKNLNSEDPAGSIRNITAHSIHDKNTSIAETCIVFNGKSTGNNPRWIYWSYEFRPGGQQGRTRMSKYGVPKV